MRYGAGYVAWATQAESRHPGWGGGRVAVVWREKSGWKVEVNSKYVPNLVSLLLMT